MTESDRAAVLRLDVHDAQTAFVEPIAETLSATDLGRDNHVILAATAIVGFFQIDPSPPVDGGAKTLELHEVIVGAAFQGKGYGTQLMQQLKPYLLAEYPGYAAVRLTVNFRNDRAHRLYAVAGFTDTGEVIHEGRSGPQHVMSMALA